MPNYVKLENALSKIKSNIRAALKKNDELMKCLIFDDDAPMSHAITDAEIEQAFTESPGSGKQRVFRTFIIHRTDDVVTSEIRIFTARVCPINQYQFEIFIGVLTINHLANEVIKNQNRSDMLFCKTADTLDGLDVGVAAPLKLADRMDIDFTEYNSGFIGTQSLFQTTVAV